MGDGVSVHAHGINEDNIIMRALEKRPAFYKIIVERGELFIPLSTP